MHKGRDFKERKIFFDPGTMQPSPSLLLKYTRTRNIGLEIVWANEPT